MSDKNNDMALGIAIGGVGGICLFVIYKLFSSVKETREELRRMRTPTPPSDWGPNSGYSLFEQKRHEDEEGWPYATNYTDRVSVGGKRKSRRKLRKRKKKSGKVRKSRRKSRKGKKNN